MKILQFQPFPDVKHPDNIEEVEFDNNIISTQMSSGPPRTRKRFTKPESGLILTWNDLNETDYTFLKKQFVGKSEVPLEWTHYSNGKKYWVSKLSENTPKTTITTNWPTKYSFCITIKIIREIPVDCLS